MSYIFLASNTVGRLGSSFGTIMTIGLVLIFGIFIFISLKDRPLILLIMIGAIVAVAWVFFGDLFMEAFRALKTSI